MRFMVSDDRLHDKSGPVRFVATPNMKGAILPELIVIHDTAGRLEKFSSVDWLSKPAAKASAHVVIERDGTVTQMVPFRRMAFHAGESSWKGRRHCNGFSIGIELVSPGKLDSTGRAWFGFAGIPVDQLEAHDSAEHGGKGWWAPYTTEQLNALEAICLSLIEAYPSIVEIVGHYHVSPRRKIDPGPHFPLDKLREAVFARKPPPKVDDSFPGTVMPGNAIGLAIGATGDSVRKAQERLAELGYAVGSVDGHYGPRMRAAVLAFEAENRLRLDGVLDAIEMARLMGPQALPMPLGARQEATEADLSAAGSETAASGNAVSGLGKAVGAVTVVETAAQLTTGVGAVEQSVQIADRIVGVGNKLGSMITPRTVLLVAMALTAFLLWRYGRSIVVRRLEDYRSGKHVGR